MNLPTASPVPPAAPQKAPSRGKKIRLLALLSAGAVLLGGGGYAAWRLLNRSEPLPAAAVEKSGSYDEIYAVIRTLQKRNEPSLWEKLLPGGFAKNEAMEADGAAPEMTTGTAAGDSAAPDYSDTNLQVAGVQEADVVKTDGRYIYMLSGGTLIIAEAEKGALREVSRTALPSAPDSGLATRELYIAGDRLVVFRQMADPDAQPKTTDGQTKPDIAPEIVDGCYYGWYGQPTRTYAVIYDISDRAAPAVSGQLGQSGGYFTSRMVGDTLYLFTTVSGMTVDKSKPETYIPRLFRGEEAVLLPAEDIAMPPQPASVSYTVITGIDVRRPQQHIDAQAVFSGGTELYANDKNILLATGATVKTGSKSTSCTHLLRIEAQDGKLEIKASGTVKGTLLNQFSMDEYDGHFRVVTTANEWTEYTDGLVASMTAGGTSNNLYVLDGDLKIVGAVEDLAKGERVYSVRFAGEIGYFVTFRQTDPLFAVDLSDSAKPTVLSALKIPGFSEYLHPYGDGLLLGVGKEADENGRVTGMKLSMFDVSDPANVTEVHKRPFGTGFFYSEASYNHKAILVSPERNLIGLPVSADKMQYMLFTYDAAGGFRMLEALELPDNVYGWADQLRGLYIDDYLYLVTSNVIASYRLDTFLLVESLPF